MSKLSLVLSDVKSAFYKEIKLTCGKAVAESYASANEIVISEYWAPLGVRFHKRLGFLFIHITFGVDLKQQSHKSFVISR
jgi:hypothetical protein